MAGSITDELKFSRQRVREEKLPGFYHFTAKVITRSKGQNALKSACYRSGEKLKDHNINQTFDYKKREDYILHENILIPNGAPNWATNREKLWNEVERAETRRDSQLAREIEIALPNELLLGQQVNLTESFIKENFVSKGIIADYAIHRSDSKDENIHAHIMLTMRKLTPTGFGKKQRQWNKKENLIGYRKSWEQYLNRAYEKMGINKIADCRTLKAQRDEAIQKGDYKRAEELNREPQKHIGPKATRLLRKGKEQESTKIAQLNKYKTSQEYQDNCNKYVTINKEIQTLKSLEENIKLYNALKHACSDTEYTKITISKFENLNNSLIVKEKNIIQKQLQRDNKDLLKAYKDNKKMWEKASQPATGFFKEAKENKKYTIRIECQKKEDVLRTQIDAIFNERKIEEQAIKNVNVKNPKMKAVLNNFRDIQEVQDNIKYELTKNKERTRSKNKQRDFEIEL